mgnify:CR=1 FL=1
MIRRAPREEGFTVLQNDTLEDTALSWDALGLLSFLLSKPDDWTVSVEHLISCRDAGRHKVRRMLSELEDVGYLVRQRVQGEDGKFEWLSVVYDTKQQGDESIPQKSVDGSSVDGSATDGKPPDITKTDHNKDGKNKQGASDSAPAREEDPAVAVYHEVMPRRASNFQQDKIAQTVDDVDRWRDVVEEWRLADYNPGNLRGMLDVYENGWDDDRDEDEEYNDLRDFEPRWHG